MKRNKYGGALLALAGVLGTAGLAAAQTPTQPSGSGSVDLGVSAAASSTGNSQAAATATPSAQVQPEAPPGYAPGVTPTQPPAATQPPVALPPPAMIPPPAATPAPELPDHERVAGHSGVGLLGVTTLENELPSGETANSSLPLIGIRHWAASKGWGWQVGVGASHHSGTSSDSTPGRDNVDDPTTWNMGVHFGLPLAVYWDDHYTFLVLPNVNGGYSTWRQLDNDNTPGDQGVSGNAWSVSGGMRVGAEIHFGFIGVPMLTLQGTIGADLVWQRARVQDVEDGRKVTRGRWNLDLRTADFNDPWALFTNSISALYYFQ